MAESLDATQVRAAIVRATSDLEAHTKYLSELDAAIGDGDMGLSIANGCRAIRAELPEDGAEISGLLGEAGLIFSEAAGATIGALVGTALIRAGGAAKGKSSITLADLAQMLCAAESGIRDRGKAEAGDKTLLDAIIPAREALEAAATGREALAKGGKAAVAAAKAGTTATIEMTAKFGRGRWLGERSKGHQDAGATAVYLLLVSLIGEQV